MKKDFRYDATLLSRASFPAVLEAGNRPCIVEKTDYRLNAVDVTSLMLDGFDPLLYSVNAHPKWWHLYKHAKKYRVRKKYRKRLMQQLIESLRAAPDPLEVIT